MDIYQTYCVIPGLLEFSQGSWNSLDTRDVEPDLEKYPDKTPWFRTTREALQSARHRPRGAALAERG
jgi:hypothetical protein